MTKKEQLFQSCETYLKERIDRISAALKDLEADLENETKSSAGDKYETGREMINLEWNKLSVQLQQFRRLDETLEMAKSRPVTGSIQLGSLVQTSVANYFIAIPAGQVKLGEETFFCIGANSPIAQVFLGKKKGDTLDFNGKQLSILSVD